MRVSEYAGKSIDRGKDEESGMRAKKRNEIKKNKRAHRHNT